jgi:ATP-dependent DNA helicase RecG
VLLFGTAPQRFIPGGFTIYSAYPGTDRTDPFAQRVEISGTLIDQARRLQQLLDAEVVTLFDKTNLKTPNAEKYPRRALHEAMVNALAHRDYELVDPTRITSYRDRIEFISPGSLPVGITLEELRTRNVAPRWRNQALAWFLVRLQLAQAEGQGIETIRSTMKAAGCPPPIFDASEVSVTCVLRAHPRFGTGTSKPPSTRSRKPRRAVPRRAKPKRRSAASIRKTKTPHRRTERRR